MDSPLSNHHFLGGSSSWLGNEVGSTYQSARDAQKIFWTGRMSGSLSSVPAGTITAFPDCVSHGRDDPHCLQNVVAKYLASGSSNLATNSSPFSQRKSCGETKIFEAKALPVNFLHLEQWQYWKVPGLPLIS
jgi:hypothetical protein